MCAQEYIDTIRNYRNSTVVLKTKILTIRSGDSKNPILVFEGKTDIGPYETWINRIDENFTYRGVYSEGKKQTLDFRKSVEITTDENLNNIYYIIDSDFDGSRGHELTKNIFLTDSYSFENYLTSLRVLDSILKDELECSDPILIEEIKEIYKKVSSEFCVSMKEANLRLFTAGRFGIEKGRLEKKFQNSLKYQPIVSKRSILVNK